MSSEESKALVRQYFEAIEAALIEVVRADMAAPPGENAEGGDVVFPMEAHILVARKTG